MNKYTYCNNNPLRYDDKDGYFAKEIWGGIKYVGKRLGAVVTAGAEIVYDVGKGAFDLGYEIGNYIMTGDATTLKQMPGNMLQGIGNNLQQTFNWDNFKNYWNPDATFAELHSYTKSTIQTGLTVYGGYKALTGITNMASNIGNIKVTLPKVGYTELAGTGMGQISYIPGSVEGLGTLSQGLTQAGSGTMLMASGNMGNIPNNQNKLNHIFNKQQHNLNDLLDSFKGDQTKAFDAIRNSTEKYIKANNINGNFKDIVVKVNGFDVTVRGTVINGQVNIGTVFIP